MKKIIRTTVILLASVTTFQSCFEVDDGDINAVCNTDCTTIQGRFTTEDGKPIKDLNIEINWDITYGGLGVSGLSGKTRKLTTGKTDANGNYKSVFYVKDEELASGSFLIKYDASEDIYIVRKNYTFIELYSTTKRDTIITVNYHVPKRGASIDLKIKNPEAITGDNHLATRVYYKSNGNITAGELFSKTGSTATFKTASNQFTYIKTTKTINGQDFNLLDSVFISVNQTKKYEIEF